MSELDKVEERRGTDMDLYLLPHKVKTGLDSDTLPLERGECTPAEIRSSVAEAGTLCSDVQITREPMTTSVGEASRLEGVGGIAPEIINTEAADEQHNSEAKALCTAEKTVLESAGGSIGKDRAGISLCQAAYSSASFFRQLQAHTF